MANMIKLIKLMLTKEGEAIPELQRKIQKKDWDNNNPR